MKRVHFFIYDELAEQISEAIQRHGFHSQSEFFRYLAMEFLHHEKDFQMTEEVLKKSGKQKKALG